MTRAAFAGPEPGDADLALLRERLAAEAEREGLVDLAYRTLDSRFGPLLLVASPLGLVRVAFAVEGHDDVLARLAEVVSPRILRAGARTDEAARQLDEYLGGRRRRVEVPLDLVLIGGFRRSVVERLPEIPYGATATYAALARRAGSPGAVRAVGSACSHNPLPLVLPCHRVVRSDGSLGGYLGGAPVKAALLAMEAETASDGPGSDGTGRGGTEAPA